MRTNVGRTLVSGAQTNVYRTADLYIGVSAANNLDTAYDALPARDAALVVDVAVGGVEEAEEAARGVSEWLSGDKDVRQVVVFHVDYDKVVQCRGKGKGLRLRDAEQIGSARRWGRDTKGGTVLLEEMVRASYPWYPHRLLMEGFVSSRESCITTRDTRTLQ